MTVGICGLGLIGGSMARAYTEAGHTVLGYDRDSATLGYASLAGIISDTLDRDSIPLCDLIFVALYPDATIQYLEEIAPLVSKNGTVMDLCGTKEGVCKVGFELAERYGFVFVGGHPMAGTQYSGIKYSKATLFKNAPMVIVPPIFDDIAFLDRIKQLLAPAMFGKISVCTAQEHDRVIAFTSQLAHITSSAYVKSPEAQRRRGFSAGSFRDMTRVARLDEDMWTELFLDNKDFLADEIDGLICRLQAYSEVIRRGDAEKLKQMLRDGKERRLAVDEVKEFDYGCETDGKCKESHCKGLGRICGSHRKRAFILCRSGNSEAHPALQGGCDYGYNGSTVIWRKGGGFFAESRILCMQVCLSGRRNF